MGADISSFEDTPLCPFDCECCACSSTFFFKTYFQSFGYFFRFLKCPAARLSGRLMPSITLVNPEPIDIQSAVVLDGSIPVVCGIGHD